MGESGNFSHYIRTHHVIKEFVSVVRMFCVCRDCQHIIVYETAFIWNYIFNVNAVVCFLGTIRTLENISAPSDSYTDIGICQIGNKLGWMEVTNVWSDFHKFCGGFFVICRIFTVLRKSKVVQCSTNYFCWCVQYCNAALGKFFCILFFKQNVPWCNISISTESGCDLFRNVAYTCCTDKIRNTILVIRIKFTQIFHMNRIEIFVVRKFRLIKRHENTYFKLTSQKIRSRSYNIIAGLAGQKFCFQNFVWIINIVNNFDTGFFFKVWNGIFSYVFTPVVHINYVFFIGKSCTWIDSTGYSQRKKIMRF